MQKGICGLNCENCPMKERCGGCSFCWRIFCDRECRKCSELCRNRNNTDKLLEKCNFGYFELLPNEKMGLPAIIPILPDHMQECIDVGSVVGVHGRNAFSSNGEAVARVYRIKGVQDTINLAKPAKGVLEFYVQDRVLEGFWDNRIAIYRQLKEFKGLDVVISPNFSVYDDSPRAGHLYNISRSVAVYNELIESDIKAVPDVSWSNEKDLECWIDAINAAGVGTIAFNFQSVSEKFKASNSFVHFLAGFKMLVQGIGPDVDIIISGLVAPSRVQLLLRECSNHISVLNQTAYIHSCKGVLSETRKQMPELTKNELLLRNINYYRHAYERSSENA